ncbi:hypothetical protein CGZ80_08690 [Rhodopirellula sp. MGV]|nr:hypothetical protein CGZ80_08690 [Rhodopirellula sp. MGV]PNY38390.1 hypothetical protein C2E31_00090 [Rhodopirellula baltica]
MAPNKAERFANPIVTVPVAIRMPLQSALLDLLVATLNPDGRWVSPSATISEQTDPLRFFRAVDHPSTRASFGRRRQPCPTTSNCTL